MPLSGDDVTRLHDTCFDRVQSRRQLRQKRNKGKRAPDEQDSSIALMQTLIRQAALGFAASFAAGYAAARYVSLRYVVLR
jgi:hypothetical protein